MSKFDDEWTERREDVKDRMAERLKEYGFELDRTEILTQRSGDGKLKDVHVDFVGEFTGPDKRDSVIAAILKDEPYKDVVTFIHNITSIKVDTKIPETSTTSAIDITTTAMEEPTLMYAWSGLDFYEVFKGDKEEKEVRKILDDYILILYEGLRNWIKNIQKEYIIEMEKEYWRLMDEYQTRKCRNGEIFDWTI